MRLLLDEHISPAVARQLRGAGVDATSVRDWQGGNYRSAPDDQLLAAAAADQRILVTFDLRTIPPLLKEWAEAGQQHAGVVLIDDGTIRPDDVGGLVRAFRACVERSGRECWTDRVVFIRAKRPP